ncbi:DUF167 domain-containing protein [Sphingopyxis jiangsuensis]|uniref:DUF167 domain-containing protein n=1 Tax=Sphingopyxis jiangsuensis TaxID=2871171 RepID=UPI002ED400D3
MRVVPGVGRDTIKISDNVVQVRVSAPPADGAANEAVLRLLAKALDRPRSDLSLLRGTSARTKLIGVSGLPPAPQPEG